MSDMHHFDLLSNAIKRLNTAMRCFHVPANVGKLAWGKRQGEWAIFLRHKDQWIRFADANLEQRLANVENLKELIDVLHDTQAERADQIEEAAMEIAAMAESLEDTTDAV